MMMKKIISLLFTIVICYSTTSAQLVWDKKHLKRVRKEVTSKQYKDAYSALIKRAENDLKQVPLSILNKKHTPASGDMHDYMSLSRYYWPDPSKTDGLPYISRDGLSNPELNEYDRNTLGRMSSRVQDLVLAWYLSRNQRYADKALEQVKVWFVNADTRMNPNMNYAQMIPGRNGNMGNSFGILDAYSLFEMIDALIILESYSGFKRRDKKAIKAWFQAFVDWMQKSEQGVGESKANNNHGTTYDVQLLAFSLYCNDKTTAREIIKAFPEKRIFTQIEPEGSQPLELKRTQGFMYSWYNMNHMLDFCIMAKRFGMPVDNATSTDGRSFYKAVEFLAQYVGKNASEWPYTQMNEWDSTQQKLVLDMYRIEKYLKPNVSPNSNWKLINENRKKNEIEYLLY